MMLGLLVGTLLLSSHIFASPTPQVQALDEADDDTSFLKDLVFGMVMFDENGTMVDHQLFDRGTGLMKRADQPPACAFITRPDGPNASYRYTHYGPSLLSKTFPGKTGDACIGWTTNQHRRNYWGTAARDHIIDSMGKQIKKDGFFKASSSGEWHARFDEVGTTAFRDNDIRPFSKILKLLFNHPDKPNFALVKQSYHYVCVD